MKKYTVKSDRLSAVLTVVMLLIFGGITLALKTNNNGAFIITGVFTAIIFILLIFVLYRMLFFKVLIEEDGFFYQTSPFNGRFYSYYNVKKAWTVMESAYGTGNERYLNILTCDGNTLRIPFSYKEKKGVNYLVKRANELGGSTDTETYFIGGKDKTKRTLSVVLTLITVILNIALVSALGFNAVSVSSIVFCVLFDLYIISYCFFFCVKIERDGFYCRKNFFSGKYYPYADIVSCCEVKKRIKRNRHNRHNRHNYGLRYFYVFTFTDIAGKKRSFPFEKKLYAHEIEILKERINKTP